MLLAVEGDRPERKGMHPPADDREENKGCEQEKEIAGAGNTSARQEVPTVCNCCWGRIHLNHLRDCERGSATDLQLHPRVFIGANWFAFLQRGFSQVLISNPSRSAVSGLVGEPEAVPKWRAPNYRSLPLGRIVGKPYK